MGGVRASYRGSFIWQLDNELALESMKEELQQAQQERASKVRTAHVREWSDRAEGSEACELTELLRRLDPLADYPMFSMAVIAYLPTKVTWLNIAILVCGSVYYGAPAWYTAIRQSHDAALS